MTYDLAKILGMKYDFLSSRQNSRVIHARARARNDDFWLKRRWHEGGPVFKPCDNVATRLTRPSGRVRHLLLHNLIQ